MSTFTPSLTQTTLLRSLFKSVGEELLSQWSGPNGWTGNRSAFYAYFRTEYVLRNLSPSPLFPPDVDQFSKILPFLKNIASEFGWILHYEPPRPDDTFRRGSFVQLRPEVRQQNGSTESFKLILVEPATGQMEEKELPIHEYNEAGNRVFFDEEGHRKSVAIKFGYTPKKGIPVFIFHLTGRTSRGFTLATVWDVVADLSDLWEVPDLPNKGAMRAIPKHIFDEGGWDRVEKDLGTVMERYRFTPVMMPWDRFAEI